MSARLFYRGADGSPLHLPLSLSQIAIGRDAECHIRTRDHLVSGIHCVVLKVDTGWVLEHRSTTNPTFVGAGSSPVSRHALRHGDLIQCGSLWVQYLEDAVVPVDNAEEPATEITALRQKLVLAEQRADDAARHAQSHAESLRVKQQQVQVLAEKLTAQSEQSLVLQKAGSSLKEDLDRLQISHDRERKRADQLHADLAMKQADLKKAHEQLRQAQECERRHQKELAQFIQTVKELETSCARSSEILQDKERHIASLSNAPSEMAARIRELERQNEDLNKKIRSLSGDLAVLTEVRDELSQRLERREGELRTAEHLCEQLKRLVSSVNQDQGALARATSENSILQGRLEAQERATTGLRQLLGASYSSLHGSVIELTEKVNSLGRRCNTLTQPSAGDPEKERQLRELIPFLNDVFDQSHDLQGQLRSLRRQLGADEP